MTRETRYTIWNNMALLDNLPDDRLTIYIYTFRSILLTTARRSFEGRMAPPNWQFRPSAYGLVLSRCLIVYLWHAGLYCSATCKVNTVQSATSFDNNTQGYYCCGIYLWVSVSLTVLCDVGC